MKTDLQTIQIIVLIIKDIITGCSALVVAIIAVLGLKSWRTQLKGKTEYDLACRFLKAVYEVRSAMAFVRNPFQSSVEISLAMEEAGIEGNPNSDPEISLKSQEAVYQRRWQKVQNVYLDLESIFFEAETLWGKEVEAVFVPFRACIATLSVNIKKYLRELKVPTKNFESERKTEDIVFSGDSDNNHFSKQIEEAVKQIEDFLKPHLRF